MRRGENKKMAASIETIGPNRLAEYASVPMTCEFKSMLVVEEIDSGVGGLRLRERPVQPQQIKDYDVCDEGGPLNWPQRFDISRWGLWIARERGDVVGGAAVTSHTVNLQMLEGRPDQAVLWDIRVPATNRLQGIGTALFQEAARWAKSIGCRLLKIETQNVNVGACRFYARMGCSLGGVDRFAYRHRPDIATETMLTWYLDLSN
jgi:GNAT superfamily N-acetyltransferase